MPILANRISINQMAILTNNNRLVTIGNRTKKFCIFIIQKYSLFIDNTHKNHAKHGFWQKNDTFGRKNTEKEVKILVVLKKNIIFAVDFGLEPILNV